jgi:hypothetical protein
MGANWRLPVENARSTIFVDTHGSYSSFSGSLLVQLCFVVAVDDVLVLGTQATPFSSGGCG